VTTSDDARLAAARAWLAEAPADLALDIASIRPASADASFRRYFRLDAAGASGGTAILMDAPPEKEDSRAFLHVAQLLGAASLNAPRALAQDLAQGFLLLTDLGSITYLQALREPAGKDAAPHLFADATSALLTWQLASRPEALPPYDAALLQRQEDVLDGAVGDGVDAFEGLVEEHQPRLQRERLAQRVRGRGKGRALSPIIRE
jgi:aminoglycoside/choline kinase family phosphotransferase